VTEQDLTRNAEECLVYISKFGWPDTWPERPEALTFDDLELWHAYRKHDRGERLGKEETEQLTLLHSWRAAVWTVESTASARLKTLCSVLNTFESQGRAEEAARVRRWIRQQFRCELPLPCPHRADAWLGRFVEHFGRNFKLLPVHLRKNTKPPEDYQPAEPPQQKFTQFAEDDDG
jgi:hypothetical protein